MKEHRSKLRIKQSRHRTPKSNSVNLQFWHLLEPLFSNARNPAFWHCVARTPFLSDRIQSLVRNTAPWILWN